jgi:transposase InsO family protein
VDRTREVRFGTSTIERWYYQARTAPDPVGALARSARSDAGKEKAISPTLLEELARQYGAYPNWSYRLHADNLAVVAARDRARYGAVPSYPTVRRAMQRRGWVRRRLPRNPTAGQQRALQRLERREVRLFEASAVHALWHFDFHHGSRRVVDPTGRWHTPLCLCILDDRSRVCCHIQWFLAEDARSLVHGLVQAFCKRGLPRALLHDNGAAMVAAETVGGIDRLGIVSDPTLPYSPDQNGKQERFWATIEGRLCAMLDRVEGLTLDFLNQATQAWIEGEYNQRLHEEIGTTPIARLLAGPDVSRPAPDLDTLRRRFTRCETRIQRRSDGTLRVGGRRFEVPSRFRTLREVHVRWRAWDLGEVWLVDGRTDACLATLRPVDREHNGRTGRRALPAPETEVPRPGPDADPIPPLLAKLLAEHAATGLPPAYLPLGDTDD